MFLLFIIFLFFVASNTPEYEFTPNTSTSFVFVVVSFPSLYIKTDLEIFQVTTIPGLNRPLYVNLDQPLQSEDCKRYKQVKKKKN